MTLPKVRIVKVKHVPVKYFRVSAKVRYWEDAIVNGERSDEPTIFGANGDCWDIIIEVDTGKIVGWPVGMTAKTHFKVCDAGEYTLIGQDYDNIKKVSDYVPSCLYPLESGYGDYIILNILADGTIDGWKGNMSEFDDEYDE